MNIKETDGKAIFKKEGIRIPMGFEVFTVEEAVQRFRALGSSAVIKPIGIKGRGKRGLVSFVSSEDEAADASARMLGLNVDGHVVDSLIIEERVDASKEYYFAFSLDFSSAKAVAIAGNGGINVEDGKASLERHYFDLDDGFGVEEAHRLIEAAGIAEREEAGRLIMGIYKIFRDYGAETVEINPAGVDRSGKLIALDAVISVDSTQIRTNEVKDGIEARMWKKGWSYVDIGGDIGLVCSGAGLAMATLDMISMAGGKPANFLDLAQVDGDGLYEACCILSERGSMKAMLVNLFAGLNRCDEMAEGVRRFVEDRKPGFKIVVRMAGNMVRSGENVLLRCGIRNFADLESAVKAAVDA